MKFENNFNLIRFLASTLVLVSHSFAIVGLPEPHFYNIKFGLYAVFVFFVVSGYLVTKSLISRSSIIDYLYARFLRIYPGLFFMLIIICLLIGVLVTDNTKSFFLNETTYKYIFNSLYMFGGEATLPDVFSENPLSNVINGSLWTLQYELRLYIFLGLFWFISSFTKSFKIICFKVFIFLYLSKLIFSFYFFGQTSFHAVITMINIFFLMGTLITLYEIFLQSHYRIILKLIALISILSFFIPIFNKIFLFCVSSLLIILFGNVKNKYLLKFNNFGDYSYGIYIYAFPVQQCIYYFFNSISVINLIFLSFIFTFIFSYLSWHFVEKFFLKFKLKNNKVNLT